MKEKTKPVEDVSLDELKSAAYTNLMEQAKLQNELKLLTQLIQAKENKNIATKKEG